MSDWEIMEEALTPWRASSISGELPAIAALARLRAREQELKQDLAAAFSIRGAAAEARVQELEAALAWYAERRNYAPAFGDRVPTDGVGMVGVRDSYDGNGPGARARRALEPRAEA